MTSTQLRGLFAFAILQNKTMLISNLNNAGYPTSLNIRNQQLTDKLYSIYLNEGFNRVNELFSGVKITDENRSKAIQLRNSFLPPNADSSAQKTFLETLQELWAGAKDVIGGTKETKSEPAVTPLVAAVVLTVLAALIGVIIWKS